MTGPADGAGLFCPLAWASGVGLLLSGAHGAAGGLFVPSGVCWGGLKGSWLSPGSAGPRGARSGLGHSSFTWHLLLAESVQALGSQQQGDLPGTQGLPTWQDTELSRGNQDRGSGDAAPACLAGGAPQCPCFVLKMRAGAQGHPLVDLLKQPLAPRLRLADLNNHEIE